MNFLSKLFSRTGTSVYEGRVQRINELETEYEKYSDDELKAETKRLRLLPEEYIERGFALVREAAKRVLNQRHFDVQLIGGLALYDGMVAEMATGEGKTLAATAPVFARALTVPPTGGGVHVITVNDYLALRDAVWMGQIYHLLGMKVSCIVHDAAYLYDPSVAVPEEDQKRDEIGSFKIQREFLRPITRKEAYEADIVYGTNHEFGFDYLRDNLAYTKAQQVQRGHYFAVIDEVDSILIDEARTPLIISAPDAESAQFYKVFAHVVRGLEPETDYTVDEKAHAVSILDAGIEKVEKSLNIGNLYDAKYVRLVHYLEESLKAKALFHRDKQYIVRDGQVVIVDEFTGRLMHGRRYSGGLHQALEAKEGVQVQQESKTYAQITIQNYFRLYEKMSGMTGTAATSAEEFRKVYGLEVMQVPTHKPRIRKDVGDRIYKTKDAKYDAIIQKVKVCMEHGQPVLVGTTSIDENERLSGLFSGAGIAHEALNAKNHEREGEIIAQAGRAGKVMLATNVAGRGVDIVLGGNPPDPLEAQRVRDAGGLFVLGTQRNEARRIDNQLRGRSGRQGDPGITQFFLSLEDDMLRIFGGDRIKSLMGNLNIPDNEPIESRLVSKVIDEAQKKVEGLNFDARKHLLDYDDVLNRQRTAVYRKRQNLMEQLEQGKTEELLGGMVERSVLAQTGKGELSEEDKAKVAELSRDPQTPLRMLAAIDMFWTNHLENLEALLESVRIRAYGQKDPLVEYKRESYDMFKTLLADAEEWVVQHVFTSQNDAEGTLKHTEDIVQRSSASSQRSSPYGKVGRNDPCPCGSGLKYKKCHGK
ncbi:preprotein translocase subunit SecA [Candidatus Wolfebacteria bacterium RIFCSPHIGHO2_01_FULL_48_22]|uniref:Protein translocase subunit SecA n=2 Tax=Candidatus Wolfeibacteriota TaxID=1752735 RepID=A0A1F8DTC4_9BACT|nr:MAG: preprotein translocase subunit SecA [Candidatus Wolfebacteria bacterium RIFCSPHIGHO2_01_FULL_48_22]OGM93535.1 MAG: preprotein translocase subunit SecA [Candidatus Wolfebacteria bacterium RIFCSPLOWO2_01_FULL_47_17b]